MAAAAFGSSFRRRFVLALTALGAVAATLFFVGSTRASGPDFYTVLLAPTSVQAGSTPTVTITNCDATVCPSSPSTGNLGSVTITIPGYTPPAASVSVTASGGENWSATVSTLSGDGVIDLTADSTTGPDDTLPPGDSIDVQFKATQTLGSPFQLGTAAFSSNDSLTGPLNNSGSDPQLTVTPGPLDHFAIDAPTNAAKAGTSDSATVTAYDQYGNVDTDYDTVANPGDVSATLTTNLHGSANGCPYSASPGPSNVCTVSTSLGSFNAGLATASFTAYQAESGRTLTVEDATGPADGSAGVEPGVHG